MKKSIIILLFLVGTFFLKAQQVGMNNHYYLRPFLYNPAYTGIHDNIEAFVQRREQWNAIGNAPKINIFSLDGSVNNNKISLGVNIIDETRGFYKRTGFNFNYAYHLDFNAETSLSFGIAVGMSFHSVDFSNVVAQDYNDLTMFSGNQQTSSFSGNAGFVFKWRQFEINGAVPQLLGNKVKFYDASTGTNTDYTQVRHFIANFNYKYEISRDNRLYLVPCVITRFIPNAPFQFDGTVTLLWKNKGWVGATYKSKYAVSANAGVTLFRRLDIGYSYEFITTNQKSYAGLSHEIMLRVKFGSVGEKKKNKHVEEDYVTNENEELPGDSIQTEEVEVADNNTNTVDVGNNNVVVETINNAKESPVNNTANIKEEKNLVASNVNSTNNNNAGNNTNNNVTSPTENTKTTSSANKYYENGILIMKELVANYKLLPKNGAQKGFYVIIGTFYYQDFAENEAKRLSNTGGYKSGVLRADSKDFNYIYIYTEKTLDKAIQRAKEAQNKGFKDAWVKILE